MYSDVTWLAVLFALGFLLAGRLRSRLAARAVAGMLAALLPFFLPAGDLTVLERLKGLLYEPSIGLVICCLMPVARAVPGLSAASPPPAGEFRFLALVLGTGIALYPMALGLGYLDPYALGYQPWFALAVSVIAALAWWRREYVAVAAWLTAAVCLHAVHAGESSNVFDYMLDPIVVTVALVRVIRHLFAQLAGNHATG